jgi:hypothetical protein
VLLCSKHPKLREDSDNSVNKLFRQGDGFFKSPFCLIRSIMSCSLNRYRRPIQAVVQRIVGIYLALHKGGEEQQVTH